MRAVKTKTIRLVALLLLLLSGRALASGDPAVAWLGWAAVLSHIAAVLFAALKKSPVRGRVVVTIVLILAGCWLWLSGVSAERYLSFSWLVILLPWVVLLMFYILLRYPEGRRSE
jgi:hypothetical protein